MNTENFKKTEQKILKFWQQNRIFEKSLEQTRDKRPFVFFEGPPTANGRPHIGHFLTRIYKDLYCRYKTMRGFFVLRRAGWDTHGLPVEIEIEKQLGLKNKKDIEIYGIAKFNKKAKASVWKYKSEWEQMTRQMGFWLDMSQPYVTYDASYMESVWWLIKRIADKNLLFQGHKVVPYCARCGTALSSHEVDQGYKDVTDTSVYIKFELKNPEKILDKAFDSKSKIYLLAWTTTPWTLPGNVALAVGEKIKYSLFRTGDESLCLAATERLGAIAENHKAMKEIEGKDLIGLEYEPLFDIPALRSKNSHKVYPADFVLTTEGAGIVHTAVMYGEEDYELGKKIGLPLHHTVDEQGKFTKDVPLFAGQFARDAGKDIIDHLKDRGLVFKAESYLHSYPFCWRCDTPLIYYAKNSWFVKMSALRKKLLKNNSKINWVPEHIKVGRFGDFLKGAKDWALSRERYWGTPLPVWQCQKKDCGHGLVIGSLAELEKYRFRLQNTYLLLRHGHSAKNGDANKSEVISSKLEFDKYDLTPKGIEQIKKLGLKIKKGGGVDLILSSPFLRTRRTAQIISEYTETKVKIDKRLKELDHGAECEGKNHPVCLPSDAPILFDTKRGDGESWRDIKTRVASLINELEKKHEGKKILLVTHGDPLWQIESLARNLSEEETTSSRDANSPSVGELRRVSFSNWPRNEEGNIDLHRPHIDEVILKCPVCQSETKRIPDLIDVWFDSGAMPFAQWHYPFENKNMIDSPSLKLQQSTQFPADFITEAIDQTRGWFYTLLAIATAAGFKTPFKNVLVLGHTLDENGQKMSKSKGNVIMAGEAMEKLGSDPIRWYFHTLSTPDDSKIVSLREVETRFNKFYSTIQNVVRFLELYTTGINIGGSPKPKNIFDLWLQVRLNQLIRGVTDSLENYKPTTAARLIENFIIEDLSNWWLRRSRKRFQPPATEKERIYVGSYLRSVLLTLSRLLAPLAPFVAEELHNQLHTETPAGVESVHLHFWPKVTRKIGDAEQKNLSEVEEIRELTTLGLAARKIKQIKVRRPLAAAFVKRETPFAPDLEILIRDELNVKEVSYNPSQTEKIMLDEKLTNDLVIEGYAREITRQVQDMRKVGGYNLSDRIFANWDSEHGDIKIAMTKFVPEMKNTLLLKEFEKGFTPGLVFDVKKEFELAPGVKISLGVRRKK